MRNTALSVAIAAVPGMAMPSTATAQTDFPDQSRFQKVLLNDRPGEPMSATAPQCDLMPLAADLVLGARFASGGCGRAHRGPRGRPLLNQRPRP